MRINPAILACLIFVTTTVFGEQNPYFHEVNEAKLTAEMLQEALEQLRNPPAEPREEPLRVPAFHQATTAVKPSEGTLCAQCHKAPPHRREPRLRSFLNMHTAFIACETCHWQPPGVALSYGWMGSADEVEKEPAPEEKRRLAKPGRRIAPFYGETLVSLSDQHEFARQLAEQWESGSLEKQAELKARLHQPLGEEGVSCGRCHQSQQPLLDLAALGADGEQVRRIQHNPIARFLGRTKGEEEPARLHLLDLLE